MGYWRSQPSKEGHSTRSAFGPAEEQGPSSHKLPITSLSIEGSRRAPRWCPGSMQLLPLAPLRTAADEELDGLSAVDARPQVSFEIASRHVLHDQIHWLNVKAGTIELGKVRTSKSKSTLRTCLCACLPHTSTFNSCSSNIPWLRAVGL